MQRLNSFKTKLIFETSSFSNEKSRHVNAIEDHTFVHGVDVLIPNVSRAPPEIQGWPEDATYYKVSKLRLANLIDKELIGAFIKKGKLFLLSVGSDVDTRDVIALLPCGTLILNITKDSYEELGLEGQPSRYNGKRKKKFVIKVDLVSRNFSSGSHMYERTLRCFTMRKDMTFDCLFCWKPHDNFICSSSIAKYFESKGLQVSPCVNRSTFQTTYTGHIPRITPHQWSADSENSFLGYADFFDWSGAISCHVDSEKIICQENLVDPVGQIFCAKWRGFLTPILVKDLLSIIRTLVSPGSSIPWIVLTAHGFEDSPVSFGKNEHGFHKNGDNIQSFVIFPHGHYWKYTALSTHDDMA